MLNQYLRLLPDEALERIPTEKMRPGSYAARDEFGPCLVGKAEFYNGDTSRNLARRCDKSPRITWCGQMTNYCVETRYDGLCMRAIRHSGTYAGINDAIRRRAVALLSERHAEQLVAVGS